MSREDRVIEVPIIKAGEKVSWLVNGDRFEAVVLESDAHEIKVWHKEVLVFRLQPSGHYDCQISGHPRFLSRLVVLRPRTEPKEAAS